ncbi:MAG TPA: sigma-70 family RNA polymerase sigma factor [Chitinivibrionales bacterium]|jgi:RNA polymerase sigma-70 factor (ECF subfamily)|nr:sigma-70 family RNA polymerase sigma factor [Chitinivibrionales bacterium]
MDNETLTSLYATHAKSLYNYVLWMTRNTEASKDILQTVFIRLWKSANVPQGEDDVRRWLYTAAKNACYDSFRSHARFSRLRSHYTAEFMSTETDPHDGFFWDMLSELSETERCILYLHLKAGYSYAEIGRIVELSESNVRVKVCRAIKRLRDVCARSGKNG